MKKRITALALAAIMVMGTVAVAAGTAKTITVTPMTMTINGQVVTPTKSDGSAAEVFAYDGATYVPLRYLSELLGIQVDWDTNDPGTAKLVGDKLAVPAAGYVPGTYTGSAQGMGGAVTVQMAFDANSITAVTATGADETPGIGTPALEQLPDAILKAQSAQVDAIAGATITSAAVLAAAKSCVEQAKGTASDKPVETDVTADVIVVGGGAAGLSAAASAVSKGASVIVLEANSALGGAAGMSMGNLVDLRPESYVNENRNDKSLENYAKLGEDFFTGPWKNDYSKLMEQVKEYTGNGKEKGRFVTLERIMVDHYIAGMTGKKTAQVIDEEGKVADVKDVSLDYEIVRSGIENALNIYNWLAGYGLTSTPTPRMEYCTTPVPVPGAEKQGTGLIKALAKAAEGAEIRLNTRGRELVTDKNGKVVGVIAEDANGNRITFHANSGVVLATGGFSGNTEMVTKYLGKEQEPSKQVPATNVGDGIVMAEALDAQLRDMSYMSNYLTFGGLVVDTHSRVLDTEGKAIEGLYAGGDVCSGVEGATHQSGNNMTILINMGRIAGENAAGR